MRAIAFVVLSFLAATAPQADTGGLTIATGVYAPFSGNDLPDDGIVNAAVRRIATAAGYDVEFRYMPWARALEETRDGAYDASSYWFRKAEREAEFFHVGPLIEERTVFFARADGDVPEWTTLDDLAGLRIGVVTGYTYTPELWDMGGTGALTLSEAQSDEANLRKLLAGRVDVVVTSQDVGYYLLDTQFTPEEKARLKVLEKPLIMATGYLLLPRGTPRSQAIAAALQAAIDSAESKTQ